MFNAASLLNVKKDIASAVVCPNLLAVHRFVSDSGTKLA
jgi:hypothetical protein